jgi:hypothetical protein
MKFIDYNSYLFESEDNNLQYYYCFEQRSQVLHIVLMKDDICIGYINFWKYKNQDWEAISCAAEHGYGYKMFEAAMDLIYPEWFIPTRNKAITSEIIKTISRFIDRPDIETEKIDNNDNSYTKISEKNDNWFNRRYRLNKKLNIDFKEADYNFIKRTGIKLFSKKYPWSSDSILQIIIKNSH